MILKHYGMRNNKKYIKYQIIMEVIKIVVQQIKNYDKFYQIYYVNFIKNNHY